MSLILEKADRLRVLHLVSVPFRPEEGVSRAATEIAIHTATNVESHLAADQPVGDAFVGLHRLVRWKPWPMMVGRELRQLIDRVEPDLVHLHGGIVVSALALAPASRRVPVVASIYQLLPVPLRELGVQHFGDARRSAVRPTRIAASKVVGGPLTRQFLADGTISVVCTPDPRVAAYLRASGPVVSVQGGASPSTLNARWADQPTIGFAGRAERGRGVEELIAGFEVLRRDMPHVRLRLMLLPGPAATEWIAQYAGNPNIELSVGVHPSLDRELAGCQLVALPFRIPATITPPLVAAQAMSVGVPVVATALSCMTPLVRSGFNGMLTPSINPNDLADAFRAVLRDKTSWEELSVGARTTIETEWNWATAASATERAYSIALDRTANDSRRVVVDRRMTSWSDSPAVGASS